jgi:predicted phosphodiesterase
MPCTATPQQEEYGYFKQRKLRMRVFNLNELAGATLDWAHLYPLGDSHEEDVYADLEAFDAYCEWIRNDPRGFVIGTGDLIDAVNKHSKGDAEDKTKPTQQAMEDVIDRLRPVAHKILVMVGGNHDRERSKKESNIDIARAIAKALDVYYEPDWTAIRLKVGSYCGHGAVTYDVAVSHGMGAARTPGGRANMIGRMAQQIVADLYVCGHVHNEMTYPAPIYVPVEGKLHKEDGAVWIHADLVPRRCLIAGTLRAAGGYSMRGLYAPNMVSMPRARLNGSKKWIKIDS